MVLNVSSVELSQLQFKGKTQVEQTIDKVGNVLTYNLIRVFTLTWLLNLKWQESINFNRVY